MPSSPTPKPGILSIAPYVGGKSSTPAGKRLIKLSSNESPLGPSPKAIEAYQAQGAKLQRYPDGSVALLREAIAKVHGLDPARIVCGAGSDEVIGLICHAYAGQGDEVLMSRHGFLMYKIYTQSNGAELVMAGEDNLTTSVDQLLAKVNERTRIVFVANPNNPTGTYITGTELKRLHKGLPPHVLLGVDAAYAEYVQEKDYADGLELASTTGNTVMFRTFSKIYALPALRIGWGYMPAAIADVLNRIRGPFNVSSAAIAAAAAAVADKEYLQRAVAHNARWLPWLSAELQKLGLKVTPSAGNFVLVEFAASGKTAEKANEYLMGQGIIVRDVKSYDLPSHLRITVGLEDENKAVISALRDFLK